MCVCVCVFEGACVLETPQFHTCLILSEFGVKGFVVEFVWRGGGLGTGCRTLLFNGVTEGTLVCCLLFPLFIL